LEGAQVLKILADVLQTLICDLSTTVHNSRALSQKILTEKTLDAVFVMSEGV